MPESTSSNSSGGGVASSAISPIASLLTTWISNEYQQTNVDNTIQANKDLAEYAYSKDLEMWNRQNEYNTPAAQMSRYQAAGLNPNLIYGQGSSGNATQMPRYQAPTVEYAYRPPVDPQAALAAYQDFQMRQAQIDNVRAQTQNVEKRTQTEGLIQTAKSLGIDIADIDLSVKQALKDVNVQKGYMELHQSRVRSNDMLNKELISRISSEYAEALKRAELAGKRADIQSKLKDIEMKGLDIGYKKLGVGQNDPLLARLLARALEGTDLLKNWRKP